MRKAEEEEIALLNVDREPLQVMLVGAAGAGIIYGACQLLIDVNPMGFIAMVPGAFLAFYCLWLFLHPFAQVFEKKFEIKYSFLSFKSRYYVDIKQVQTKKQQLYIVYNDDEVERIRLFGIKPSQILMLKDQIEKKVTESLKLRS